MDKKVENYLQEIISNDDFDKFKECLDDGKIHLNDKFSSFGSLLLVSIYYGALDYNITKYLISIDNDINLTNKITGETAIVVAAGFCLPDICECLILAGASVIRENPIDHVGFYIEGDDYPELVINTYKMLIKYGANPGMINEKEIWKNEEIQEYLESV